MFHRMLLMPGFRGIKASVKHLSSINIAVLIYFLLKHEVWVGV